MKSIKSKRSQKAPPPIPPGEDHSVGALAQFDERKSSPKVQPRRDSPWVWGGFLVTLTLSVVWVLAHAFLVDAITVRLCENEDAGLPPEKRLPVFLSEIAFDGYVWNRHAEDLGKHGDFRVRWTDFDNAPKGREVHWNSAFAWYLRALGEVYRAVTGDTLRNSIYRMSIWANPILLIIALLLFSAFSAQRFGPLCGSVLAVGMVSVPTFYEGFWPAYPDHHGLIGFSLLGLVFGIAWAGAGWVREAGDTSTSSKFAPVNEAQARQGMLFSAVCGAAGLWFSALSTAIVLGTVGISAIIIAAVYGPVKGSARLRAEVWWYWAKRGAAISLGFYLLEYFPFYLGFRLEVNHPFYSLAWLGGGAALWLLMDWLCAPEWKTFPLKKLLLPVAACLPLPLAILLGGPNVYIPSDPFMGRLWKNIAELLPLITRIKLGGLTWSVAIGWFPIFIIMAFGLLFSRKIFIGTKATLLFLSIPILLVTTLQFYQVRWGMLNGPLYIALAALLIPQAWRLAAKDFTGRLAAVVILATFGFVLVRPAFQNSFLIAWQQFQQKGAMSISPGQGLALLHRRMARAILDDAKGRPVVLLSSPNSSCLLAAMGGFRTIGTLYWENVEGLKAAAAALNAQSDMEALELLRRHGVTHISNMTWENFIEPYFKILYPGTVLGKTLDKSFAKKALFDGWIPAFTRPLLFQKNSLSDLLGQRVLLLAFAPEMSQAESALHLARYKSIVEGKDLDAEFDLNRILENSPDYAPARIELARLMVSQRRYREMAEQLAIALPDAPGTDAIKTAAQLATEGRYSEASSALDEALKSNRPQVVEAARQLNLIIRQQPPTSSIPSAIPLNGP